jgi:hypothetical protein
MPANISTFTNEDNEVLVNFVSRDKPAWWGAGIKTYDLNDNVDLVQATKDSYCNYDCTLERLTVEIDGLKYEIPDRLAVYRQPIIEVESCAPRYLGIVSLDYSLIQNLEFAEIFNEVSKKFPVETVGSLGNGEKTFWCMNGGEWEITAKNGKKQLVKTYFNAVDDKIARQESKIMITPVLIVCQNTEQLATNQANVLVGVFHRKGNKEKLEAIRDLILEMQNKQETIQSIFNNMAITSMTPEEFSEGVLNKLYPNKIEEETEVFEQGILINPPLNTAPSRDHLAVLSLFGQLNDERMAFANTSWNAYNSITEYEDWIRPNKGKFSPANTLFGKRADTKSKGFSLIVK